MNDIIAEVKKYQKGWTGGLPETPCGSGSKLGNTRAQRAWIPKMLKKYNIKTIADIGAGDLNWIKHTDLCGAEYTPYDLVPRHPDVTQFDLLQEIPPQVDLIICLWVLNHLPYDHCQQAIGNIKASGSKHLMFTDRPIWRHEYPPELQELEAIESVIVEERKKDCIKLVELC